MADSFIPDNRPQQVVVFEGQVRKFFELAQFNGQTVPHHVKDGKDTSCRVYLPEDPKATREIVEGMPAYKNWLDSLLANMAQQAVKDHVFYSNPYRLKSIDLQAPTWFPMRTGPKLGFLKAQCTIETVEEEGQAQQGLPGAVFLRGGSVGVLIIIQPYDGEAEEENKIREGLEPELFSVLTIQPRIAAGSLAFAEIPAGMLDGSGDLGGKAGEEIQEEVGITINKKDLFNMSEAAVQKIEQQPFTKIDENTPSERIANSMYPSPGGCDEFLPLMLLQKRLSREDINDLQSRKTGLRDEGEVITLKVVPFKDLWKHGGRDAKCLAALGLYENLKREGLLPDMPAQPDAK